MNIAKRFFDLAKKKGSLTVIITPNREFSYDYLVQAIHALSGFLLDQGVAQGDVVSTKLSSELELIILYFAILNIDATVLPLPPGSDSEQTSEALNELKVNHVIVSSNIDLNFSANKINIDFNKVLSSTNNVFAINTFDNPISAAFKILGSGSTGKPKVMIYSHELHGKRAHRISRAFNIKNNDLIASDVPVYFISAINRIFATLLVGGKILLTSKTPLIPEESLLNFKPTHLFSTVFHMEMRLSQLKSKSVDEFKFLECLNLFSSLVSQDLRKRVMDSFCENIYVNYGTNESGLISCTSSKNILTPDCVGIPLTDTKIEIVDDEDNLISGDCIGQIRVKNDCLMHAYSEGEALNNSFRNGFFYTGDLGKIDCVGNLIFMGRSDNMIINNGINIYPVEIEQVVLKHSIVKDVYVFALENKVSQDVPVCAIELNSGYDLSDLQTVAEKVRKTLGFKGPRQYFLLPKIPRDIRGKVAKQELMKLINL